MSVLLLKTQPYALHAAMAKLRNAILAWYQPEMTRAARKDRPDHFKMRAP